MAEFVIEWFLPNESLADAANLVTAFQEVLRRAKPFRHDALPAQLAGVSTDFKMTVCKLGPSILRLLTLNCGVLLQSAAFGLPARQLYFT
jgi:hypothetical protein